VTPPAGPCESVRHISPSLGGIRPTVDQDDGRSFVVTKFGIGDVENITLGQLHATYVLACNCSGSCTIATVCRASATARSSVVPCPTSQAVRKASSPSRDRI
jgi:hypothetical protein